MSGEFIKREFKRMGTLTRVSAAVSSRAEDHAEFRSRFLRRGRFFHLRIDHGKTENEPSPFDFEFPRSASPGAYGVKEGMVVRNHC